MPPKHKLDRRAIVDAAVELVRAGEALNARGLAKRMGCSTQPIFSNFSTMEELKAAVVDAAHRRYEGCLRRSMEGGRYPPYKASGMGYIRFAMEEKELFKLLFMRDRRGEVITDNVEELEPLIRLIQEKLGLSFAQARRFHLEMWLYVHGAAVMLATDYLPWSEEDVSGMLTDAFEGLRLRYRQTGGGTPGKGGSLCMPSRQEG